MGDKTKLVVGSDHAGYGVKLQIIESLRKEFADLVIDDIGCYSEASCDYPDFAQMVGEKVGRGNSQGLLICGSGIGMAIAANKCKGVRAAVAWDATSARLSREHNDANIVCVGARLIGPTVILDICKAFLKAEFQGGRHDDRIKKILIIEGG